MNTRLGKSFGLAFVVAVGILALMFALGTFNAQQAGAQEADDNVELSLDTLLQGQNTEVVVTVDIPNLRPEATIMVALDGLLVSGTAPEDVVITGGMTWPTGDDGPESVTLDSKGTTDVPQVAVTAAAIDDTADPQVPVGLITITLPADTDLLAVAADAPGDDIGVIQQGLKAGTITITIESSTAIMTVAGRKSVTAIVTVDADGAGGDTDPAVGLGTSNAVITGPVVLTTDTQSPGAVAFIEVEVDSGQETTRGRSVTIDMGGFGLPTSIGVGSVLLENVTSDRTSTDEGTLTNALVEGSSGSPRNVTISGSKLTFLVPDLNGPDEAGAGNVNLIVPLADHYRVVFLKTAGVSIPTAAGSYTVEATVAGKDDPIESNPIEVNRTLSLSEEKGSRGISVTLTGKGYASVQKVFVEGPNGNNKIDTGERVLATDPTLTNDGFEITFEADTGFVSGENEIKVVDRGDITLDETAIFMVTGDISLDVENAQPGEVVTITLEDADAFLAAQMVKIGNDDVPLTSVGDGEYTFTVPAGTTGGTKALLITIGEGDDKIEYKATILIAGLPITVTPSTAVPGQAVTVRGEGFTTGASLATVTIGGERITSQTNNVAITSVQVVNGSFVFTATVPVTVDDEGPDVPVIVTEYENSGVDDNVVGNGRNGIAMLTIPEPSVTIEPMESRRGSRITATGNNFIAGQSVTISYEGISRTAAAADSTGGWTQTFTVPVSSDIDIDSTHDVKAEQIITRDGATNTKTASVKHTVPGAVIAMSPMGARPGDTLTITGDGFKAYASVSNIEIGALTITSVGVNTDDEGDFTMTAILPSLPEGPHTVTITVGGNKATLLYTVGSETMITTRPSEEAFADLVTADNLIVVWYFDNDTKGWSFYDPRPAVAAAVDLDMVSSGDNVWVQITADQMFQGKPLTAGWNLHTLQ